MAVITLLLSGNDRVDVSSVISALQVRFSGTLIVAENSFEAERNRAKNSMAELAIRSDPIKNPQLILQRISAKENSMGPGVDVSVPIGTTILTGHIWEKSIMLSSDSIQSTDILEPLISFLESLGVGTVELVA
jgi:hypothetical protein